MDRRRFLGGTTAAVAGSYLGGQTARGDAAASRLAQRTEPGEGGAGADGRRKFEPPMVRFAVTADGPACFDIAEEAKGVVGPVGRGERLKSVPKCLCQCPCECICECPCECPSPCYCKSPCAVPGKATGGDPGGGVPGETYAFGRQFMIRHEDFGGVLFNKDTFAWYYCNHAAFEILRFVENRGRLGMTDLGLVVSHLRETFQAVPDNVDLIVRAFIAGCAKQAFLEPV